MKEKNTQIKKQIDAYVKGKLTEDEIVELWNAFAKDPSLLDDLELEVGLMEILKGEASSKKDTSKVIPKLPAWTWHAAAAAVLVIVGFIQVFQNDPKTELDQFVVRSIPPDQVETSDGIRAKDMILVTADSLLNLGFQAFISGNSNQALALYNEVITNHDIEPYGSKAFTNKGILLYNSSEYDSSIVSFDNALIRVQENRMIEEKAFWYKGNALINIGELEEARRTIQQAYALDGVFRRPAFLLLQKLNYDLGYIDYDDFESQIDGQ